MAKAKKAKNEEQRVGENSNSEAVVKHQKLCLAIDMDNRRIYGYTEMRIVVPDNGIVGLHADNLAIEKVTVEGEPAEFEVFPHYQPLDPRDRWSVVSSTSSAADASGSVYLSSLETELLPNLLIMCSKTPNMDNQPEESIQTDKEVQPTTDACRPTQDVKNVRIDYWVEKAETGIHFNNDVLHTDNQLRRARCWFPCMDDNSQCCCYDMEYTVARNLVAVSSGTLLHQILTNEDPPRKTYVYKLDIPVAAHLISLAVAPFEILADQHVSLHSHFCLPSNLSKLQNTVAFFQNAFSYYEDYLSAPFPLGTYKQVFIFPEMAVSSLSSGASISIFSSHLLFDEKLLDQTIEARIKLAYALARQWFGVFIIPEDPTDEWLLDGLAEFLTDSFIKRFLGHNEARYRRYKANHAVCQADDSGATALSSTLATKDLYGTQSIGFYGKIRSRKSVAILQMLEKQMGPESFRKILQNVVLRARDGSLYSRSLSTKEFRHYANKIGNLERPFLKEFFPRWVGSCGCPVLKMGFSYNKRKNMVELAVLRGCTSKPDSWASLGNKILDSEIREGIVGWPGMMSIRVHELDGMYDHPILPMSGEQCLLLEIQCHSKLAAKRFQKSKKSTRTDGSDDNGDAVALNSDSPLLWLRADPEIEYLADVHFNQPMQMWINQLEKDKDVVAQTQAIAVLKAFQQLPSSVINDLNNFLTDSKAFWRVRIQAAYALATTPCEDPDKGGLRYLIDFYKSKRFDPNIDLPRPNDFNDVQEYFVLKEIPLAIAMVRTSDNKSPREAVEFILQLLTYNDNSGNPYSDVFWVSTLVQSVGELEFREQGIVYLTPLLKRLDRLLQFDRLMPSHNGILTVNCIQSLSQMALKLSEFLPLDNVAELINPYRASKIWQIRVAASRALLELEFYCKGTDAALTLLIRYLKDETSLRGQTKVGTCALRLCQMIDQSDSDNVKNHTLVALLHLLESPLAFNNTNLRHCIFCILQVLARRDPTLFGVPKDETLRMAHMKTGRELKSIFAALIKQPMHPELPDNQLDPECYAEASMLVENHEPPNAVSSLPNESLVPVTRHIADAPTGDCPEQRNTELDLPENGMMMPEVEMPAEGQQSMQNSLGNNITDAEVLRKGDTLFTDHRQIEPVLDNSHFSFVTAEVINEPDRVSSGRDLKKPKLKIRVRQSAVLSRPEDHGRTSSRPEDIRTDADRGASSSVSVEQRNFAETVSTSHQNFEDANSCQDVGSRVTASIGSARPVSCEDLVKELQCTADSSKVFVPLPSDDVHTPRFDKECQTSEHDLARDDTGVTDKEKGKKKHTEKKRKKSHSHDDLDRKELKRQKKEKKEKKRKEKEMAKLLAETPEAKFGFEASSQEKRSAAVNLEVKPALFMPGGKTNPNETRPALVTGQGAAFSAMESGVNISRMHIKPIDVDVDVDVGATGKTTDGKMNPTPSAPPSHKIKIKFKNRSIGEQ